MEWTMIQSLIHYQLKMTVLVQLVNGKIKLGMKLLKLAIAIMKLMVMAICQILRLIARPRKLSQLPQLQTQETIALVKQ